MHEKTFGKVNEWLEKIGMSTFTIFLGIAIVVLVYYFIYALEKKMGYSREKANKFLIILGASLFITYLFAWFFDTLFHYFRSGNFDGEGITYIAGFLGGAIAFGLLVYFFLKDERNNIFKIFNFIIPGVILAHAIGRLGCFSVGCCYGKPTDSIFGFHFPAGTNAHIDGFTEAIHPTQLYEAFFLFGLFFLLKIKVFKNYELAIYLIFYGIFRFLIEVFFRGDNRGLMFGVAPSIILSLLMVVLGLGIFGYQYFNKHKTVEL